MNKIIITIIVITALISAIYLILQNASEKAPYEGNIQTNSVYLGTITE